MSSYENTPMGFDAFSELRLAMKNPKSTIGKSTSKRRPDAPLKVTKEANVSCCGGKQLANQTNDEESSSDCCGGLAGHMHDGPHVHTAMPPAAADAGSIDRVCGMTVDPETTNHRADCKGETYYFCSGGCKTKFQANPAKYLKELPRLAAIWL